MAVTPLPKPPHYEWREVWDKYVRNPHLTQVKVDKPLKEGQYLFFMNHEERHQFGDLTLARGSQSMREFEVK